MSSSGTSSAISKVADRRLDVRYVGPISGCYTLSDRRDPASGDVEVFACRTQSISAAAAAILAPVAGAEGDWLTARFDGIGIVRGPIDRLTRDGFVFQIVASDQQRQKLAAKIDWIKKKSVRQHDDKRDFKRFQPRDPRSAIVFPDGKAMKCFVIDVSRSGAAVSAHVRPEIGTPLVLGTLRSRVVRHLDVGFALEFDAAQDAEGLEQLTTGYEPVAVHTPPTWDA